jgi:hypothetical protein
VQAHGPPKLIKANQWPGTRPFVVLSPQCPADEKWDAAKLDDGAMWPTSYALSKLTPADEKKITALVKKAAR